MEVLDMSVLDQLRSRQRPGRPDIVQTLLDLYVQSAEPLVATLESSKATQDDSALQHATHTLKSSSMNIGAMRLSALCVDVEQMLRDGASSDARRAIPALLNEYRHTLVKIETVRTGEAA